MRAFIILGFLIAASSAGSVGYNYASSTNSDNLQGSGSSLVGSVGLGGAGLIGNRVGNTVITSSPRIITTGGYGGYGGNIIGSRYGTGLYRTGGLIGTGGLVSTGGYGGRLIGAGGVINAGSGLGGRQIITTGNSGLIGGGRQIITGGNLVGGRQIITGGSGLIGGGRQIITGGSGLIGGGRQIISGGSGLIGGGLVSGGATNVVAIPSIDSIPQTVEYSKQFFHFDAPEEIQEEGVITKELSNVLKKNLQVVFVKAPENNAATNAALQLAKQAIEQKTDIYVLSKQNDGAQLVGQLQQIQENVPTVPDVRIIKYRTPEDLAYAKEIIQAQYENTGGSTQSFDGGVAPVLNYASGARTIATGGALLGSSNLVGGTTVLGSGSSNLIGGGAVLGSGLGTTTTIVDNGSLLGSGIGSTRIIGTAPVVETTKVIETTPLVGSTQIIGSSPLLGSGITTTKIIDGGLTSSKLINGGSYALGSEKVTSFSVPENDQYLPPLKKK